MRKLSAIRYVIKNPLISLWTKFLFWFTLIILAGVTRTHDYIPYSYNYYGYMDSKFETGYSFISNLTLNMGFSFDIFKMITLGIGLILIHVTVKKFVPYEKVWIFYILYLIYPMTLDTAAIRNTLAMSIFIFAFPYLTEEKIDGLIKYILLILLASMFHKTALIYILFVVIRIYVNGKKVNKTLVKFLYVLLTINVVGLIFYRPYLNFLLTSTSKFLISNEFIGAAKGEYFEILGNYGFLIFALYQLHTIYILNNFNALMSKFSNNANEKSGKLILFIKYLLLCNLVLIVLIPFYKVNSNYFRLYRNLIPLNYVGILAISSYTGSSSNNSYISKVVYLLSTIALSYIQIEPMKEIAFYTLFTDNWILNLIR